MMKFKPYINPLKKKDRLRDEEYIVTVDMEQKNKVYLGDTGIEITMMREYNPDNRDTHPVIATIVYSSEGSQFKEGDTVWCKHFTFEDHNFNSKHFYEDEHRGRYFKASKFDVMFGIKGDEIVPRTGILICEKVQGKFIDTTIEVEGGYEGARRDIARVVQVWEGGKDYKVGDYVMLKYGADYPINFKGRELLKVDHYFDDVYAITDTSDTYDSVLRKHVDHYKGTDSINEKGY